MMTLRALAYGTAVLAGLAVLAGDAFAQDFGNKGANAFRTRTLITAPTLGNSLKANRQRSVAMRAGSLGNQKPVTTLRALGPSLGTGANLRLKETLGQANSDQGSPHPNPNSRKLPRNFNKPMLVKPLIQVPPAALGLTPAGRKIEALRDKLGLESIATVEGAGSAPVSRGPSRGGSGSGNADGAQGLLDPGQGAGQPANSANAANDCVGAAGEGLRNPSGQAESRGARQRGRAEVRELIRDIERNATWSPGLRVSSFRYENGVLRGRSAEGHDVTIVNGSEGAVIIVGNESADETTSYFYDRTPVGLVHNRTEIAYGPDSSEPGTVQTDYPPGNTISRTGGNTITQTRHRGSEDSQPAEGADAGAACGEAAVRHKQDEAERRRTPTAVRFRDPGPNIPDGVTAEPWNPRTRGEADDMTCQPGPDGDECRAHNAGPSGTRHASDFAQPVQGVDGPVIPGPSTEPAAGEATGELIDPRPDGDPDAIAGR